MFIFIVFWGFFRPSGGRREAVGTSFIVRARFTSVQTRSSLLTLFICFFILFHSCCSHVLVFMKTLLHEFLISYNHILNATSFFQTVQLQTGEGG